MMSMKRGAGIGWPSCILCNANSMFGPLRANLYAASILQSWLKSISCNASVLSHLFHPKSAAARLKSFSDIGSVLVGVLVNGTAIFGLLDLV